MVRSVSCRMFLAGSLFLCLAYLMAARSDASPESRESLRPYWVFLESSTAEIPPTSSHDLSPRAVRRLARVGRFAGGDLCDHMIPASRLAPLVERGIEMRHASRFLQAASALLTRAEASALAGDPRVREVRPVVRFVRGSTPEEAAFPSTAAPDRRPRRRDPHLPDPGSLTGSDYGEAWEQLEMLGIPELHARGYSGMGVLVAVFDSGFFKDHASLRSLNLVAERDFVQGDSNVQHDPADTSGMHPAEANRHGTYTWSALAGFAPGRHLGAAYRASFVLARTEDISREVQLEEDHFIAALEWADSLGVDLISSSLGYLDFDDGSAHSLEELDGHTLAITQATAIAAGRGILVVTAMGNEGPGPSSLIAPADGESLLSVGAVRFSGGIVDFSSRGPTGDGRIKPDVTALGLAVHCASAVDTNAYGRVSGTSLATPLVSGLAALLMEADASRRPHDWILALRSSGDRAGDPTNSYGWGIPDGLRALGIEGARLHACRYEWTESRGGDGIIDWGETGELRVRVRNEGAAASQEMTLSLGDHDELISFSNETEVLLPSIAPGDSAASGVLATASIAEGETDAWFSFFVRFAGGEADFGRKVYAVLKAPTQPVDVAGAYPNPIRTAPVRIPYFGSGLLDIYSVDGRLIRRMIIRHTNGSPGSTAWDLEDASGRVVPPGVYFARCGDGTSHRICVVR